MPQRRLSSGGNPSPLKRQPTSLAEAPSSSNAHLIDSPAAANLGLQRALFSSEDTGIQEKYRPWAMPEPAWLQQMAERIRNRG